MNARRRILVEFFFKHYQFRKEIHYQLDSNPVDNDEIKLMKEKIDVAKNILVFF